MSEKEKVNAHPLADLDRTIHSPARLMLMTHLYVVKQADYVYLMQMTGLTWGNIATHMGKLEDAAYVEIEKTFVDKKPHSMVKLTKAGREAFKAYKDNMTSVLNDLPD